MRLAKVVFPVLAILLLPACAENPYAKFYQPSTAAHGADDGIVFTGTPQLLGSSGNLNTDSERLFSEGYAPIGQAAFNGPSANPERAIEQAKAIHASQVVIFSKYTSTETGSIPVTTPVIVEADRIYPGRTRYYLGENYLGETAVIGTTTTYQPYAVQKYDQIANFYAPMERVGLGLMLNDVPTELRQQIGSNYGRYVVAIRQESPAFKANILPGDVLMNINDGLIASDGDAVALITAGLGKTNKITVWRSGENKTIEVDIPATW